MLVAIATPLHTSELDQVTTSFATSTHADGTKEKQMIMIITEDKQMILLQDRREVFNKTLTDIEIPEISAIYGTARMEVINNTAYIGGFNGTIYELHVTVDAGNISVNMSTVNLNLPCTTEVFASNDSSVFAACFGHKNNTLYIVNVHLPTERSVLRYTNVSDLSNILVADNGFYFAQSNHLFRGDTSSQGVVETLQDCIQPRLIRNKNHFIIIRCQKKSIVFLPPKWSSAPGIWEGAWKDEKPYPCYGSGTAPFIFSSDRNTITFYDIRNDFQQTIRLNGAPDVETITCAWSNGTSDLVLVYKDLTCDCWVRLIMNNKLEHKNSTPIPSANGMLRPLSTSRGGINQSVLLFYSDVPQYLLLPSINQTLVDLKSGLAYSSITSNVVLYHGMVFVSSKEDGSDTGKDSPNDKSSGESHTWTVFVVVGTVVLITSVIVLGLVSYHIWRGRRRNRVTER